MLARLGSRVGAAVFTKTLINVLLVVGLTERPVEACFFIRRFHASLLRGKGRERERRTVTCLVFRVLRWRKISNRLSLLLSELFRRKLSFRTILFVSPRRSCVFLARDADNLGDVASRRVAYETTRRSRSFKAGRGLV